MISSQNNDVVIETLLSSEQKCHVLWIAQMSAFAQYRRAAFTTAQRS